MRNLGRDLIERAERAIQAAAEESGGRGAALLKETMRELLDRGDPQDTRICCAMGRCWYYHPRTGSQIDTAERWLRRALELEPGNHLARLYLGRIRFDEHRHREAREQFFRIPDNIFAAEGKPWLDLKREEWLLCCEIMLGDGQVDLEALRSLCRRFEGFPEDEAPVPAELMHTMECLMDRGEPGDPAREAVAECAALVRRLGLSEAFRPALNRYRCEVLLAPTIPETFYEIFDLELEAHAREAIA